MEELNKIAEEIQLHTNSVVKILNDKLQGCYPQGKSHAGSTPYASNRKKRRRKRRKYKL